MRPSVGRSWTRATWSRRRRTCAASWPRSPTGSSAWRARCAAQRGVRALRTQQLTQKCDVWKSSINTATLPVCSVSAARIFSLVSACSGAAARLQHPMCMCTCFRQIATRETWQENLQLCCFSPVGCTLCSQTPFKTLDLTCVWDDVLLPVSFPFAPGCGEEGGHGEQHRGAAA